MSFFDLGNAENYTIGGSRLFFNERVNSVDQGYLYLGNIQTSGLSPAVEKLDHYSSKSGKRLRDRSIVRQAQLTLNLTLDEPNAAAMNLFMFGSGATPAASASGQSVTASPAVIRTNEAFIIPQQNPTAIVVKKGATTLVLGTDYTITDMLGYKKIKRTSTSVAVLEGDVVTVDYTYALPARQSFKPMTTLLREGKAVLFGVSDIGNEWIYTIPKASLTPSGDFTLNDQDWSSFQFTLEILEDTSAADPYGTVDFYGTGNNI